MSLNYSIAQKYRVRISQNVMFSILDFHIRKDKGSDFAFGKT